MTQVNKIEIIHDWDYPFYGSRYAIARAKQLAGYTVWPWNSSWEFAREVQSFRSLEYLLGVTASYCPRQEVLDTHKWTQLLPNLRLHSHPTETGGYAFKRWNPGIGDNNQTDWTHKDINDGRIAMDIGNRPITSLTEVVDVHIKPERQTVHAYIDLLAGMKRRGLKWK